MPRIIPLVLLLSAAPAACGEAPAVFAPEIRAAVATVCVIGTVTEIEKEPVQAKPYPGAADAVPFTVAVVKVETDIQGAKNVTHVRVGFLLQVGRRRYPELELTLNQKAVLFLHKHPDSPFHAMSSLAPPIDVTDANKETVARIRRMGAAFADPLKALKADKADDRAIAAAALLYRYLHSRSAYSAPAGTEPVPAEETKAIFAALAEGDWTSADRLSAQSAFPLLGLTMKDGFAPNHPMPGQDANLLRRDEFKRWAANEGAKYTLKRIVPTTK